MHQRSAGTVMPATPPDGYGLEDFAADIVSFMDTVGIRRAVLVGSSSGGLVSQFVASSHPGRPRLGPHQYSRLPRPEARCRRDVGRRGW